MGFARLGAIARGQIWGMRQAGAKRHAIADTVRKKDGTKPTLRAVDGVTLVHDHERCLLRPESVRAWKAAGCIQLKKHPKHSVDLNVIEAWCNRLRLRLEKTAPETLESRPEFFQRLRRTVAWLNACQRHAGRKLCRGQKRRATAVLQLRGAKCKY